MPVTWDANAREDYLWWHTKDRKVRERINLLIQDVLRNGNEGLGKPGPLKYDVAGHWSRRITDEHRLVYKITKTDVQISACRYHYAGSAVLDRRFRRSTLVKRWWGRSGLNRRPTDYENVLEPFWVVCEGPVRAQDSGFQYLRTVPD